MPRSPGWRLPGAGNRREAPRAPWKMVLAKRSTLGLTEAGRPGHLPTGGPRVLRHGFVQGEKLKSKPAAGDRPRTGASAGRASHACARRRCPSRRLPTADACARTPRASCRTQRDKRQGAPLTWGPRRVSAPETGRRMGAAGGPRVEGDRESAGLRARTPWTPLNCSPENGQGGKTVCFTAMEFLTIVT